MFSQTIIIGRLGRDPDFRYSSAGTPIAKFSVATTTKGTRANGEAFEETEWHNVVFFGKTAEICKKYLLKGSLVQIVGHNHTSKNEYKGTTTYETEIYGDRLLMLSTKAVARETEKYQRAEYKKPRQTENKPQNFDNETDEDIPF